MPSFRILIVDDQREVSRLLHSALDTLESELDIVEVPSGEEAILDSSINPVDLLISDYRLPGISGVELLQKVRKHRPNAKVILITGQPDPNIRKEVSDAGADAFFIKPVPIADFLDTVEHLLGLVETALPPEPDVTGQDAEIQSSLPDLMVHLRQELDAVVVLLLDDKGLVQAHAEDLPDGNEKESLLSSLLSIYRAGQNVAHLLGRKVASNWYIFDGAPYDLVFAPVGKEHSMLVIGKGLADEEQVLKTFDKFSLARMKVEMVLGEISLGVTAPLESTTSSLEEDDPVIPEMDPLLKEAMAKLKPAEADDFWDKATNKHKAPTEPDMLSHDQAEQPGLGPDNES